MYVDNNENLLVKENKSGSNSRPESRQSVTKVRKCVIFNEQQLQNGCRKIDSLDLQEMMKLEVKMMSQQQRKQKRRQKMNHQQKESMCRSCLKCLNIFSYYQETAQEERSPQRDLNHTRKLFLHNTHYYRRSFLLPLPSFVLHINARYYMKIKKSMQ